MKKYTYIKTCFNESKNRIQQNKINQLKKKKEIKYYLFIITTFK